MIQRRMTTRQADVLRFVRCYHMGHSHMPTMDEVNAFLGDTIPQDYNNGEAVTSAAAHLKALAAKGYLVRHEGIRYRFTEAPKPRPTYDPSGMVVCLPCCRCKWSDEKEDVEHRCERQSGGYTHDESKVDLYVSIVLPADWGCPAGEERDAE